MATNSLPDWREWSTSAPLTERALEQIVLGVSTRRYARSLEPLPPTASVSGISKSTMSERFVYGTERKLAELMSREVGSISFTALLIDSVHFGSTWCSRR
jgi:putative transposase